jgi:teichuronic acid biosynthesis glycosyltransferase TuaC
LRVAVVAEYYPRPSNPGLGVWAHHQARAVSYLGVDARVFALERPVPSLGVMRALAPIDGGPDVEPLREWARGARSAHGSVVRDGIPVRYVRFVSPPRPTSYASWGRWAAPALGRALDGIDGDSPFDLVHAHYAVPAGDAVLRWYRRRRRLPLIISVHGGDLSFTAKSDRGRDVVSQVLREADAIIANSSWTRRGIEELGVPSERLHVVHPGASPPPAAPAPHDDPTLVTVANLEAHKSQADVIRAVAVLGERHPHLRYVLVGRGPDRSELEALAGSLGVADRVRFTGGLSHDDALAELSRCHVHAMPSRIDGFGVAHVEAMAAGVPTIGGTGTGAEDIARAGPGAILVRPGDVAELVRVLDGLLADENARRRLGEQARKTAADHFSWPVVGRRTEQIYRLAAK